MIINSSRQKDRNYHRSKNKLFNHAHIKSSKEKIPLTQQTNNITINLHPRAKSPSKQQKKCRSPSKQSKKSKDSVFSGQDKMMTRQVGLSAAEYDLNKQTNKMRSKFRSPNQAPNRNKGKQRLSEQPKVLKAIRSGELQKDEKIRHKQRYPKLFQAAIETPKRTPPRHPRHQFMKQQGQINMASNRQAQLLGELRQQNQFYKLIYRASLQKMKRLEKSIEEEKQEYQKTRQQFDKELNILKYKIKSNDKKVFIGHIYSYDQKDTLKIHPKNIIPQTDNQASEITRNNQSQQKDIKTANHHLPSRLSIDSR